MTAQPNARYKVVYTLAARAWLARQTEFVQRHVTGAISAASYNPRQASDHLFRQDIWRRRTQGREARRIKITRPRPGIRAICYIVDECRQLIVIKIDWRDCNPYEDNR